MRFYLGTHEESWLTRVDFPLFISHRRLARRARKAPWFTARAPWALDSGGFTEVTMFGGWKTSPRDYVRAVRQYHHEIGNLDWASPQDWMCESVATKATGRTVEEHQQLTVENLLTLRSLAPEIHWVPVVQGWEVVDYEKCVDLYAENGLDLSLEPLVGVGSVCRRQDTPIAYDIFRMLAHDAGLRTHGYGLKRTSLKKFAYLLESADSLAWSYRARMAGAPLPGHTHKSCNNCIEFAELWRAQTIAMLAKVPAEAVA